VEYKFIREQDNPPYQCLTPCVYERIDNPGKPFCFTRGDLEVHCGTDNETALLNPGSLRDCKEDFDCDDVPLCQGLVDAHCVCEKGKCRIEEVDWWKPTHDPCNFTADCANAEHCQMIADASCLCRFSECVIEGHQWWGPPPDPECETYQDCDCRSDPESCFCHGGQCNTQKWECHEAEECKKMEKCKEKECTCSGNLCEHECHTDEDCHHHYCNVAEGYKCKCEENLCAYVKLEQMTGLMEHGHHLASKKP